ncbi:hypothetical protein CGCSCA1_v013715 [Colletotrichum siamense]|nr:hypothetical protein CGCSCA1_v013715 [Colletotrichum siamense]
MEIDDDASMAQYYASTASDAASKIIDVAADGDIIMIIAVAADKYDLIATFKNTVVGAIYQIIGQGEELDLMEMLDVWYLTVTTACFDDHSNFATLTHALVWHYDDVFIHLVEKAAIDHLLAYRLCGLLESERSTIRSAIYRAVLLDGSSSNELSAGFLVRSKISWPVRCDFPVGIITTWTSGNLQAMWDDVEEMNLDMEAVENEAVYDHDPSGPSSWIQAIRKTGVVQLADARKPRVKVPVRRKCP